MLPPGPTVQRAFDLMSAGRLDQAEPILRRHLQREPGDATGNHVLAAILLQKGQHEQALFFARRADSLCPRDFAILSVVGAVLSALGRTQEAVDPLRLAVELAPEKANLWGGLGAALISEDRLDEAVGVLERALVLDPRDPTNHTNLSTCHTRLADLEKVRGILAHASQLFPSNKDIAFHVAAMSNYDDSLGAEQVRSAHDRCARLIEATAGTPTVRPAPRGTTPLRIGLLSADFFAHSVAYYIEPLLAQLGDASVARVLDVSLHIYSSTHKSDQTTARLRGYGHPWRDIVALDDRTAARQIRDDSINVLIELGGFSHDSRVGVLAHRAAAVQATYLGYPNTTGLRECDWRLVDSHTDPPGSERLCSERLVRLDPCFLCYRPPEQADLPEVASVRGGRPEAITFASFNALLKVSTSTIDTWSEILNAVPGSRLLLKDRTLKHDSVRRRLSDAFRSRGIDPNRLDLLASVPGTRAHLDLYNRADIALDPYPYNGTTTTCESLLMGVPVVTLSGDRHAARVGASILKNTGLEDLVAGDRAEYVRVAAALALDHARRGELHSNLRRRLLDSPLCDATAFARRFVSTIRGALANV